MMLDRCRLSLQLQYVFRRHPVPLARCCKRHQLIDCAVNSAMEQHSAILHLVSSGHTGAAAGALRCLLETTLIAYWLGYCASDTTVKALQPDHANMAGVGDFPDLTVMLKAVTAYYPALSDISAGLKAEDGRARWLHKVAHSGMWHLLRRPFIQPWREDEVCIWLDMVDALAAGAGWLQAMAANQPVIAAHMLNGASHLAGYVDQVRPPPGLGCCGSDPVY